MSDHRTDALVVNCMSPEEARARVNRVRAAVDQAREDLVELWRERAWLSLGYGSWEELCDAEFGVRLALPRVERRLAVSELRAEGMSTRAIGSALGVSVGTVHSDLEATVQDRTVGQLAKVISLDGRRRPARVEFSSAQDQDEGDDERGRAGPPAPTPRRAPLPEAFLKAVDELMRDVSRLERLVEDDRFTHNADRVVGRNRSDLIRAAQRLAAILERLTLEN